MRIITVAILALALVAASYTVRLFIRDRSSIRATFFWILIWLSIGVFAAFPDLLDFLMRGVMMQNRMFFLFIVAILILYAMFFRQSNQHTMMKRQVSRLAQEIALLRATLDQELSRHEEKQSKQP